MPIDAIAQTQETAGLAISEKVVFFEAGSERVHGASGRRLTPSVPTGRLSELASLVPRAAEDSSNLEVESPLTATVIGEVARGSKATLAKAVRRASRAQPMWAERSFRDRGAVFLEYHDLVLEHQDEILDLIQLETGKARKDAFEEVADVALVCRYYALNAEKHLQSIRRRGALPGLTTTWEHHPPRGVVGFIAPWNYPLTLAITDAIAALMAGNGVVIKPDRQTPFTALWALDLLHRAGLPYDVAQVVTGTGAEIGPHLIDAVDFITFTGSTETGRVVARRAADRLIGCSLELGGKNSMVVLADADLDDAIEGAVRGSFSNAGQLCISIERLFVEREIFDTFVRRFVSRTRQLKLGSGFEFDFDVGSLISAEQVAAVESHVADAVEKGATVLVGGRHRPDIGPYFFEPTILRDVDSTMTLWAEETFGPVVALSPFDSVEEAIEQANATRYGLNASLWTGNPTRGAELAKRFEAGTVNVNEAYAAAWASIDAPMGGFKDSGLGRRHGAAGILRYVETQTVATQKWLPMAAPEGVGERSYSRLMTEALKLVKRIPGLR